MFIEMNKNPAKKLVGDCVIRSIATVMNETWDRVYIDIMLEGFSMKDMPSANHVWGAYLKRNGFVRNVIPNTCPKCYSVREFCRDHPEGRYVLGTGQHAVAVVDGDYIDTWDSGDEVPVFYYEKGDLYGI